MCMSESGESVSERSQISSDSEWIPSVHSEDGTFCSDEE